MVGKDGNMRSRMFILKNSRKPFNNGKCNGRGEFFFDKPDKLLSFSGRENFFQMITVKKHFRNIVIHALVNNVFHDGDAFLIGTHP